MRPLRLLALFLALLASKVLAAPLEVVVASYNLENYVGEKLANGDRRQPRPKSEESIAAIVGILKEIAPDILGVCEMGDPGQFAAFQERLRAVGLDFPHTEYLQAIDTARHLALLSRYPIVERQPQPNLTFDLEGAPYKMERGLLDVTLRINESYHLRVIGAHLKSKLAIPQDEAQVRRHEALLLRRYVEAILTAAPETNLLLYGDFNDYRNEAPIQTIVGPRGGPLHLTELPAADDLGDRWTHYWRAADLYSRIDYFFASPALLHEILPQRTRIYRGPAWLQASDHRPIYTAIVPVNRK